MIALLQRVKAASVRVDGSVLARCDAGLLVLVGVRKRDAAENAERLAERICGYRLFADAAGRMNRSVLEVNAGLILVPQFTLAADTHNGMRASFASAAIAELAQPLFETLVAAVKLRHAGVQTGVFGGDMQVALVNDGPVTFWLEA